MCRCPAACALPVLRLLLSLTLPSASRCIPTSHSPFHMPGYLALAAAGGPLGPAHGCPPRTHRPAVAAQGRHWVLPQRWGRPGAHTTPCCPRACGGLSALCLCPKIAAHAINAEGTCGPLPPLLSSVAAAARGRCLEPQTIPICLEWLPPTKPSPSMYCHGRPWASPTSDL
jgi:hypothetical protein